jgi:hypothetical protein
LKHSPRPFVRSLTTSLAGLAIASLAGAQVVNPADKQKPPQAPPKTDPQQAQGQQVPGQQAQTAQGEDADYPGRLRSWELPRTTVVTGQPLSNLREEDPVGSYNQPRWSATRRFPTTRIYVVPEGKFEFEYWTRVMTPRDAPSTVETQYEFEIGLPHRFQLDVYGVTSRTGSDGTLDWDSQKVELRYALADWGKIPMNPTLYIEYAEVSGGPDVIESKILLGDQITEGWLYGINLVNEHELAGDLTNTWELTGGVSHTLQDEKLSLGFESKAEFEDTHDTRGDFTSTFEIGPSLQWRPVPAMHLDVAPLFGIGHDSRESDLYFVLGWEF